MPGSNGGGNVIKMNEVREARRLRNLLFDSETALTFSPMHVLFMSLGFIFIVFMLHILIKIFPAASPSHLLVGIIVLYTSVAISSYLSKK
ncbi:hypothetical protein PAEPH01_0689 [Pancytospora epiphaga]|nr:hypothetical protein PAEPH01_0689 [Pancytospora epiphaga]